MIPFKQINEQSAPKQQRSRYHKNDLRMEEIFFKAQFFLLQIIPYEKADASRDDQRHYSNIHKNVSRIRYQGRILLRFPHQVETCIAKSGYGMEYPIANPPDPSHLRNKTYG